MRYSVISLFVALLLTRLCSAQFIVDQQPTRHGGDISDTSFLFQGFPSAQLLADDFTPTEAAPLRAVAWWGFYTADNPPTPEAFRIVVYDSRASDGLPGNSIYEEVTSNAERFATGRTITVSGSPREFRYKVTLSQPLPLAPGIRYWVELAQLGDLSSAYHWENGFGGDGFIAAIVPGITDWRYLSSPSGNLDQAYQLISPEPATLALVGLAAALRPRKMR